MDTVSTVYGEVDIPVESSGSADQSGSAQNSPQSSEGQGNGVGAQTQANDSQAQSNEPWWKGIEDKEIEFAADGKQVKAPFSKVRQWAQQGYNYSQKMAAFKDEQTKWETKLSEIKSDSEIAEIADFARKNPQWDSFVREMYSQRENFNNEEWRRTASDPYLSKIQSLEKTIQDLQPEVTAFREERQRIASEAADKKLDSEVQSVADRYSKFGMDLKAIDGNSGLTFEETALQYGVDNGIPFRSAFLELYGDKLDVLREEAIKKQVANDFAKKQKEGFIGRSPTPQNASRQSSRPRNWQDATSQAIEDFKSGKYG